MIIAIYGGSFNPPHIGHVQAARAALDQLSPDRFLVVPNPDPPHKELPENSPEINERIKMLTRAFINERSILISDAEAKRQGIGYTADTIFELKLTNPDAQFYLLLGTDMFLSFESWYRYHWILDNATLAVFTRRDGEEKELQKHAKHMEECYGAKIVFIRKDNIDISSTELRESLKERKGREFFDDAVYSRVIKKRHYNAKPDLFWLRDKAHAYLKPNRVAHVQGSEEEAERLANHWRADPHDAREAAILHDITRKLSLDEHLLLCEKYGIIADNLERESDILLHAKTGAELSRDKFGISDDVYNAILWHTTGRPDMSLLEKIIYLADYIEPNRSFEGVEELRWLAYTNLDKAVELGLRMSLENIVSRGYTPHKRSSAALEWYSGLEEK